MPLVLDAPTDVAVVYVTPATRFTIKRGDTTPSIGYVFDPAIDLDGSAIRFLSDMGVDADAVLMDAASGRVRYDWAADDLDAHGLWQAEFEATLSDGRIVTGPDDGHLTVRVVRDLG